MTSVLLSTMIPTVLISTSEKGHVVLLFLWLAYFTECMSSRSIYDSTNIKRVGKIVIDPSNFFVLLKITWTV